MSLNKSALVKRFVADCGRRLGSVGESSDVRGLEQLAGGVGATPLPRVGWRLRVSTSQSNFEEAG